MKLLIAALLFSSVALAGQNEVSVTHAWAEKLISPGNSQVEFEGVGSLTNFYDPCVLVIANDPSGSVYLSVGIQSDKSDTRAAMIDGLADLASTKEANDRRIQILSHHNEYIGTKTVPVRNSLIVKLNPQGLPVQAIGFSSKFGQVDCKLAN